VSAQDSRAIFAGRYAGIKKQTNTPGGTSYDYNSLAEIEYGDSTLQRLYYKDSCAWTNWSYATGAQIAYPDSTIRDWGSPNYIYGQLYANDSLHFVYADIFGSTTSVEEFFGFKLYSTVGIKDLDNPENKLLLSPQPATDVLYAQSTQFTFDKQKPPVLYDLRGERIDLPFDLINGNTYRADVSELDAGVYFILFESAEGLVKKKLLVQH
jgi:hypothetical protein